jgi:hypothetical protein
MDKYNNNDLNYRLAELLLRDKFKPTQIADKLNLEFPGAAMTREKVYPRLAVALEKQFVRLHPPVEVDLAERVEKLFRCKPGSVRVVAAPMPGSNEAVSHAAADWAFELTKEIARSTGDPSGVWIGLGPGGATRDFASRFSQHLSEDLAQLKVNLVAITAGGPADLPQYAPVSFFNLFSQANLGKQVGFFAETFMPVRDFERLKKNPPVGMREALKAKQEVRVVVTSMGDFHDPHSLFRAFHVQSQRKNLPKWWDDCVADCQYRPFSSTAPILEGPDDLRAATLFELEELVQMSQQIDKQVILIARPCGLCPPPTTRARALLPILTRKNLRVFSKLVMDSGTARELLQMPPENASAA